LNVRRRRRRQVRKSSVRRTMSLCGSSAVMDHFKDDPRVASALKSLQEKLSTLDR
jgi:hypothetical protein